MIETKVENSGKQRIKVIIAVLVISVSLSLIVVYSVISPALTRITTVSYNYYTLDEALVEFTTDVVVAEYVRHRRFGRNLVEFEFIVTERILGDAADRIFVYTESFSYAKVSGGPEVEFRPEDLTFNPGVEYMIPLFKINTPYANTHDDGFRFVLDIVIDLDNPSSSVMYTGSLAMHSETLDFDGNISREEVIAFVEELTKDNPPADDFIRSEEIKDIIEGSPYILIVEINEPLSLMRDSSRGDWVSTDIYHVTIVESLKGEVDIDIESVVIFFANTVHLGEQHIVAVDGDHDWLRFTSRNSLFSMDQLDEILEIIGD